MSTAAPARVSAPPQAEAYETALSSAWPNRRDRIRVLFVHGTLEIGGAEEVRLSLLSRLDRSRYEAAVCCLQQGGEIADEVAALGYEVIVLGRRAHALSLATLQALRRVIRERRPHIVQTSLPRANYWGRFAAALEQVPVIIAEEHTVSDRADWARPVVERLLGPRAHCVIAVSESVRAALAARNMASTGPRTVVIPNPVNEKRLQVRRSRAEVRRELKVREDELLLVHAGRMDRFDGAKGHDILITAIGMLPAGGPALVCVLLGDGPARARLEGLAQTLGAQDRIRFLGYRRDVADFLAAGDLFALPSRIEGMPIALMEAMCMGLPAVASDIPANRETLGGGEYGRLVPPSSPLALARGIAALACDPALRSKLATRALSQARGAFSAERYAEAVSQLWEELLHERMSASCPLATGVVR